MDISWEVIKEKEKESRGNRKKIALKAVVNHLRIEFDKYYNIESSPDDNSAIKDKEKAQENFIKIALQAANIKHGKNIKSYFYNLDDPNEKKVFFKQV